MTTPLTITSLSQGVLHRPARSEEAYWAGHQQNDPSTEDGRFWNGVRITWPRWSLPRRIVRD